MRAELRCTSHFGSKMLKKMGWKEGDGLGKNSDGMKEHIRISKREESVGLGADKVFAESVLPTAGGWKRIVAV